MTRPMTMIGVRAADGVCVCERNHPNCYICSLCSPSLFFSTNNNKQSLKVMPKIHIPKPSARWYQRTIHQSILRGSFTRHNQQDETESSYLSKVYSMLGRMPIQHAHSHTHTSALFTSSRRVFAHGVVV